MTSSHPSDMPRDVADRRKRLSAGQRMLDIGAGIQPMPLWPAARTPRSFNRDRRSARMALNE